ncbi:MAG TPA: VRR-NUC domain-containing protein [Methylococcaceae bacterium]|nr:VRR-NUC domain-containing protein [Methylococcaceae bacterium]
MVIPCRSLILSKPESSEHMEQSALVDWCKLNHIIVASMPNGFFVPTYTKKDKGRVYGQIKKLKKEGYAPGFPDLIVLLEGKPLFIEMKKRGGVLSDNQKMWHHTLTELGYFVAVCYSANEAIFCIENFKRGVKLVRSSN